MLNNDSGESSPDEMDKAACRMGESALKICAEGMICDMLRVLSEVISQKLYINVGDKHRRMGRIEKVNLEQSREMKA